MEPPRELGRFEAVPRDLRESPFAIPVDLFNRIVPSLISRGLAPIPGIGIVPYPPDVVARAGIRGVVIESVRPGSSAARAGLRPANPRSRDVGDVIVAVNGLLTETPSQFANELDRAGIGRDAQLTVVRNGKEHKVAVRVVDLAP